VQTKKICSSFNVLIKREIYYLVCERERKTPAERAEYATGAAPVSSLLPKLLLTPEEKPDRNF